MPVIDGLAYFCAISYAVNFKTLSPSCLKAGDATQDEIQQTYSGVAPDFSRRDYFCAYTKLVVALKTAKSNATGNLESQSGQQ